MTSPVVPSGRSNVSPYRMLAPTSAISVQLGFSTRPSGNWRSADTWLLKGISRMVCAARGTGVPSVAPPVPLGIRGMRTNTMSRGSALMNSLVPRRCMAVSISRCRWLTTGGPDDAATPQSGGCDDDGGVGGTGPEVHRHLLRVVESLAVAPTGPGLLRVGQLHVVGRLGLPHFRRSPPDVDAAVAVLRRDEDGQQQLIGPR